MDEILKIVSSYNGQDIENTYYSFFGPTCALKLIPGSTIDELIDKYCQTYQGKLLCFGEVLSYDAPLIVHGQVHLVGDPVNDFRKIGLDKFLLTLVSHYQNAIKVSLDGTVTLEQLTATIAITNQAQITKKGFIHRFRINFPGTRVDVSAFDIIKKLVIKNLKNSNIKNYLGRDMIATDSDFNMILKSYSRGDPVPMYGSVTTDEQYPEVHWKIVPGGLTPEMVVDDVVPTVHFDRFFDHEQINWEDADVNNYDGHDIDFLLPVMYSINYGTTEISVIKNSIIPEEKEEINEKLNESKELTHKFIKMISITRFHDRGDWTRIGQALYHSSKTYNDTNDGLRLWKEYTKKARGKFTAEDCDNYYHTFTDFYRSYKTLADYAERDSKKEYTRWHEAWYMEALEQASVSPNDLNLGIAFYRCFWKSFLFFEVGDKKKWLWYDQHHWRQRGDSEFITKIHDKEDGFYAKFLILDRQVAERLRSLKSDERIQLNLLQEQKAGIAKIFGWLSDNAKVRKIRETCETLFNIKKVDITEHLDSNFDIMGCEDCVIDTSGDSAILRDGMPEDWVTMSTGHCMRSEPTLTWDSAPVKKVLDWWRTIFPDKEISDSAWDFTSSLLSGGNPKKKLFFLVGPSNAGKSGWKKAIEGAIGRCYAGTLPTVEATGSRGNSQSATPAREQFKTCNVCFIQETKRSGKNSRLSEDWVKEYTGGDTTSHRGLFKGQEVIRQRQKIVMITNNPLQLDEDADEATRARVDFFLLFMSVFSYDAPMDLDKQIETRNFPRNDTFDREVNQLYRALLWIMIQKYGDYIKHGLRNPEICRKKALEYWDRCDIYSQFINNKLEKHAESKLDFDSAYDHFKKWYKGMNPQDKIPTGQDFQIGMERRKLISEDGYYVGYTIKLTTSANKHNIYD